MKIELLPNESVGLKPSAKDSNSLQETILREVMNIEAIMQNQNETVRDVLQKVLNDMKGGKGSKQVSEVLEKSTIYNTSTDKVKKPDKEDLLAVIEDLTNQLDAQAVLMEKLKVENKSIKTELVEKKSNLAHCLDVLEDNHSNLNNLSSNIQTIIKEKETYLKEIENLKSIVERNEFMLRQKNDEIRELKDKLNVTDQQSEVNLREENKKLSRALNEYEKNLERLQEDYLQNTKVCNIENCNQLAKAILEGNSIENLLKNIDNLEANPKIDKKVDKANKGVNTDEDEKKIVSDQYEVEIALLNEKIVNLEEDLEQSKLENDDYEKQNKHYSQKIDSLVTHLQTLEKEKSESKGSDSANIKELKKEYEDMNIQKDNEIDKLKYEINILKMVNQEDELKDKILLMKENLESANGERLKLRQENQCLRDELINFQNEILHIQEEDEKQILRLQEKINKLENAENKKRKEIDECCCVVNNIKETIADKNFMNKSSLAQITLLEDQNQKLQEQINTLKTELGIYEKRYRGCSCTSEKYELETAKMESANIKLENDIKELEIELCKRECLNEKLQNDIKEIETEICRRQCTINHLEQCLDKSNKILAECEKEIKQIHFENENLKKENESLKNNLRDYVLETERSSAEKNALQEEMTKITRQSQELEVEKNQLSEILQDKSNLEDELNSLKKQYNYILRIIEDKDEQLKDAKRQIESLQRTLEEGKKEYDKIMKAYKKVKETLSEEIKKFNKEADIINTEKEDITVNLKQEPKCTACLNVRELTAIMMEKEKTIKALESENREMEIERAQLKAYVNKLISDNKNLRRAIENMLATLVEKLKNLTENEENISLKSNEMIVKDILNSLVDLEKDVVTQSNTSLDKCNCMSVIISKYKITEADLRHRHIPSCRLKCGKKIKDVSKYADINISSSQGMANICADCCGLKDVPKK